MRAPDAGRGTSAGHVFTCLALLWLAGTGLRMTILAVPPLIPSMHDDLRMSATQVGILSGLPAVLFACAAVPGSLLIARLGALATVVIGLLATGIGSALRGAVPDITLLYAATIVTAFGVAIMQPAMPPLVREWLPSRIGFGTAVYTNGLLVGEVLAVALTIPLILPLVGGSWRWAFAVWAIPCVVVALLVLLLAPRGVRPVATLPANERRWWPDWKSPLLWRLGIMLGTVNATYFAANGFLPDYLTHLGRADLISAALTSLNVGQLPASFLLLGVAGQLERRAWPYVACGLVGLAGVLGVLFGNGAVIVVGSALIGFATAATLVLILMLPPLLSEPHDVHRLSAGMFTISYSLAVFIPVVSGIAWDLTGMPHAAFIPLALCALALMALAPGMDLRQQREIAASNG